MKKTLLLSLLLGLLLAGCSRTSQKSASTTPSNSNAPTTASLGRVESTPATTPPQTDVAAVSSTAPDTTASSPTSGTVPTVAVSDPAPNASVSVTIPTAVTSTETVVATRDGTPTAPTDVPAAKTDITVSTNIPVASTTTTTTTTAPAASTTASTEIQIPAATASVTASADAPASAGSLSTAARITEWKLTADDIADEIKKSDRIERSKSAEISAGAPTGPMETGTVTNVIAAKLQSDPEVSDQKFGVMVVNGVATLTGTAQSADQIGRAMALTLETDGITKVVSRIKLEAKTP